MIDRILSDRIKNRFFNGKAIVIIGPRQSGKTTLIQHLADQFEGKSLLLNCDEPDIRHLLNEPSSTQLKSIIGKAGLLLIDEAQRIQNIGITLKLITDQIKDVQLMVTGSSALELSDNLSEPLTGRKFEYKLLPISCEEMMMHTSLLEEKRLMAHRLVYGMYPDVINHPGDEKEVLHNLSESYLFKDIFTFQDIRKPEMIEKLLQALALQLCSEVSFNELAQLLGIDPVTVQRYIELLEKAFVVFRLNSFSRNVRNELKKSRKIYFYDNGIRNSLIHNFNPLALRRDTGALWENFMVSERKKHLIYNGIYSGCYFWRTRQQQEIDYIEERGGTLFAYEFKWNARKKARFSKTFLKAYPESETQVITPDNYWEFVSEF